MLVSWAPIIVTTQVDVHIQDTFLKLSLITCKVQLKERNLSINITKVNKNIVVIFSPALWYNPRR